MTESVATVLLSITLSGLVCIRPIKNFLWQAQYRYYSEKSLPMRVQYFALATLQLLIAATITCALVASKVLEHTLRDATFAAIVIIVAIPFSLGLLTIYHRSVVELLSRSPDQWRARRNRQVILIAISVCSVAAIAFPLWIIPVEGV